MKTCDRLREPYGARPAPVIEREIRETRERMLRHPEGSRTWRALTLRHKALTLELALTVGSLSLGVL